MDVTLEITKGSRNTRWIRLKSPETFVGRREDCDVRIPSARVSRRHCRLTFRDELLHVEDLRSSNGTFLNGQAISHPVVVQPGDLLEVGPVVFRVNYPLSAAAHRKLNGDSAPLLLEDDVSLQSDSAGEELEPILLEEDESLAADVELEPVLLEEDDAVPEVEPVAEYEAVALEDGENTSDYSRPTNASQHSEPTVHVEADENDEEIMPTFDDDGPWNLPDESDLRDILSKLEE